MSEQEQRDDQIEQDTTSGQGDGTFVAPNPGSQQMPQWETAELIDVPRAAASRNWFALIGPALVMGAAAIGGGEWLVGPLVTSKYGGELMWLAKLSILGQGLYNIEITRYTLYTGEPICTGKFRTLPRPRFWLPIYLMLDFGTFCPIWTPRRRRRSQCFFCKASCQIPMPIRVIGGW